jgi:hypothetical protein
MWGFYPSLADSTLAGVHIATSGAENHNDGEKAEHAENGESKVRGGEEGPGFHLVVLTEVIVACCGGFGKGGLPTLLFEVGNGVF